MSSALELQKLLPVFEYPPVLFLANNAPWAAFIKRAAFFFDDAALHSAPIFLGPRSFPHFNLDWYCCEFYLNVNSSLFLFYYLLPGVLSGLLCLDQNSAPLHDLLDVSISILISMKLFSVQCRFCRGFEFVNGWGLKGLNILSELWNRKSDLLCEWTQFNAYHYHTCAIFCLQVDFSFTQREKPTSQKQK